VTEHAVAASPSRSADVTDREGRPDVTTFLETEHFVVEPRLFSEIVIRMVDELDDPSTTKCS
jgi:hypothetical protein